MKMKTWTAIFLGLLIGLVVAIPLLWKGMRSGLMTMHAQASQDYRVVEWRFQTMSDQALELRKLLHRLGWNGDPEPFLDVEEKRSWLHGTLPFELKLELAEDLERALLRVEVVYTQAGRDRAHVASNPYHRAWGQRWEKLKRLLVKEEKLLERSAAEFNAALNSDLFQLYYGGKKVDLSELFDMGDWRIQKRGRTGRFETKATIKTKKTGFNIDADLAGLKQGATDKDGQFIFFDIPKPYFIAEAPMPEHDYREIQYDRDTTIMAVVDHEQTLENLAQDEQPVYENRVAPEKFDEESDKRQWKVVY